MPSALLAALVLVAGLLVPSAGVAWTEARPAGMVTEYQVDRDGGATVTVRIQWRVLAGRLHQFDLAELPHDLSLLEASATNAVGDPVPLSARSPEPGRLEVSLADAQGGVRRGSVDVVVRFTTSLRAQGLIRRAGTDAVLELGTAPWEHGLAAAEVRVALPTSARRAQWVPDDSAGVEATTTAEGSRDVVRLLRHRVPAATRWTVRVAADANLFPWLGSGGGHGPRVLRRARRPWGHAALLSLGLLAGLLVLGRALSPRRPGATLCPPRLSPALPLVLAVTGTALQGLSTVQVPYALTLGTGLVLAAAILRLPRRIALRPRPNAPAGPLGPSRLPARSLRAAVRTVAFGVAVVGVPLALAYAAARYGSAALGVVAVDAAVLSLFVLGVRAQRSLAPETVTLGQVAQSLTARLRVRRLEGLCLSWTLRGTDPRARGSVRLSLQPRKGWALPADVVSVAWEVETRAALLGWRCRPTMLVYVRRGAQAEQRLRALAERVGALRPGADDTTVVFVATMEGDDVAPCLEAVWSLLAGAARRGRSAVTPGPAPATQPYEATQSQHLGQLLAAG